MIESLPMIAGLAVRATRAEAEAKRLREALEEIHREARHLGDELSGTWVARYTRLVLEDRDSADQEPSPAKSTKDSEGSET